MRSTRTSSGSSSRRTTSSPTCRTTSPARSCTRCSASRPRPERLVLMVQREVAERIAAPPGKMSYLSVFVQYHARVRIAFTRPPGRLRAGAGRRIGGHRRRAVRRRRPPRPRRAEDELWRLVQASFRERRKMIHNVLARQLPVDAGAVAAALCRGRHRPRPAPPDPRGRGVAGPARGARPDRTGPARPRARPRGRDDRRRPVPPADAGRPARPGQAQPDAGRRRAPRRTATTRSTRSSCRSRSPTD